LSDEKRNERINRKFLFTTQNKKFIPYQTFNRKLMCLFVHFTIFVAIAVAIAIEYFPSSKKREEDWI
jgi:hypothetical protein